MGTVLLIEQNKLFVKKICLNIIIFINFLHFNKDLIFPPLKNSFEERSEGPERVAQDINCIHSNWTGRKILKSVISILT